MAPAAVPDTLPCETGAVFAREVKDAKAILELEETEESWEKIARAIARMHALYKGGGYQFESDVVPGLKTLLRPIVNAMNSDRSRLSFVAIDFVASLASLGRAFEPLLHFLFDALLKLCTRTSKVLIARAEAAILRVIEETTLPAVLPHLREAVKDKSQTLRTAASVAALQALQTFAPRDLANKISDVEEIIKCTGRDANPAVRQTSRKIFEAYQILFPDRVDAFTAPLSPTMKKYLAIKPRPVTTSHSSAHAPPLASAPSTSTTFPASSNHVRSASASEHAAAASRREHAAPPPLRAQRSRAALRAGAEMPPPPAPHAPEHADHASFQPARSAPGPQRTRAISTVSAKSVQAALAAIPTTAHDRERQRVGPQRILLADPPTRPLSLHDTYAGQQYERVVSGPSRVQRPASALGTVSVSGAVTLSSSSNEVPAQVPAPMHRAQRVLAPVAPPPPPPPAQKETKVERVPVKDMDNKVERVPSREKEYRVERAPSRAAERHDGHGSGSNSNSSSRPPSRPASAASMASRAKTVPVSNNGAKPPTAPTAAPRTRTISTMSKSTVPKAPTATAASSRPPVSKSAAANKPKPPTTTTSTTTTTTEGARSGFVPKRNNQAGGHGGGATGMTAAALSRAKELREARERTAAASSHAPTNAKPTWGGRPAANANKNAKVAAVLARKAAKKPVEVPLPPSPGAPPREVPLPDSPLALPSPVALEVEELVLDGEKENFPTLVHEKENGKANVSIHDLAAQVEELERMVLGQVNAQ